MYCQVPTTLQSVQRTKVSTVDQQALRCAQCAEESKGHKALGIHQLCLRRWRLRSMPDPRPHPRPTRPLDAARGVRTICLGVLEATWAQAKGLGLARPSNPQGQATFAKIAIRVIGPKGCQISVRCKKTGGVELLQELC